MSIEQAIELAIKGGYLKRPDLVVSIDRCGYTRKNEEGYETSMPFDSMLLDIAFWKCWAKSMGWENFEVCSHCGMGWDSCGVRDSARVQKWLYMGHALMNHLAEGKSIEQFFATIPLPDKKEG